MKMRHVSLSGLTGIQRRAAFSLALFLSLSLASSPAMSRAQERAQSPSAKEKSDCMVRWDSHGLCRVVDRGVSSEGLDEAARNLNLQPTSGLTPNRVETIPILPGDTPATQLSARALNKLRPPNLCGMSSPNRPMPPPTFHRLDGRTSLAIIPPICTLASNNVPYMVVLLNNSGRREALEFDTKSDALPPDMLTNAVWRDATLRLESTQHYRMVGDCGRVQSFAWDGRKFRLVEIREMSACKDFKKTITTRRAGNWVGKTAR
jgi:hypothetical protein